MEFLNFMFQGIWHFLGCAMIIAYIGNFLFIMWNRFWRHFNIRKHGYPPINCDADGDFKNEKKKE